MLDRDEIIQEAIDKCMEEMYQKSQPKGSYFGYIQDLKNSQIKKDEKVYERHFLRYNEFNYIRKKYKKAYRLENEWKSNVDFLLDNLKNGGYETVYVEDKNGTQHSKIKQMQSIEKIIGKRNAEKLFNYIEKVRDFYRFDREEEQFDFAVCLGASPTSNPETVKKYWKSKGIDIQLDTKDLSQDDYWEIDEYGHLIEEEDGD